MNEKMKKELEAIADITLLEENMGPYDCVIKVARVGNFDDAYQMGLIDGEAVLARKLLTKYFKEQ